MTLRFLIVLALVTFGACTNDDPPPRLMHRPPAADEPAGNAARTTAEIRRDGNQLAGSPSPYLLQHAHNPVDWYPWGDEALERARTENRPIFLSIGYSTCHWCHVMEEESFEDDEVAAYLNAHFVAIKVDREQRPDIDALFMESVRQMGSSTGWPLTVFLTPGLAPFFGGTYFPRHTQGNRPGFLDVLRSVRGRYAERGEAVGERGREIFQQIESSARSLSGAERPVAPTIIDTAFSRLASSRDTEFGGFGSRQKFPNAPLLLAELRYVERTGNAAAETHLRLTLGEAMRGGVRDHIAGSFHRYAVDRRWHVPHFEKTLYDNAQLAQVYVEAGRLFHEPRFIAVGREILDDLVAAWQRPDGGFVVGFDADDPGGEGAYYTWTPAELNEVLGAEDGRRIATMFGVTGRGERSLEGRSVLHRIDEDGVRNRLSLEPAAADVFARGAFARMRPIRDRRPPPSTDDKELAAWNGLAIIALANVGRWLNEPRYIQAAARAASFVLEHCFDESTQIMLRGRRQGASLSEGFLDDYALPLLGMLRLHAADGNPRWLLGAHALGRAIVERFYDASLHSFHQTARSDNPEGLPLRRPDLSDGVLPSGSNAATLALLELGAMAGDQPLRGIGERAARVSAAHAARNPFGAGFLLVALDHLVTPTREVVIAGAPNDPVTRALYAEVLPTVSSRVLPIRVPAAGAAANLITRFGALNGKVAMQGRATAYVCEVGRCELPTSDPAVLHRQLDAVGLPPALRR